MVHLKHRQEMDRVASTNGHLKCTSHCGTNFTCTVSFPLHNYLLNGNYFHSYFTYKNIRTKKV